MSYLEGGRLNKFSRAENPKEPAPLSAVEHKYVRFRWRGFVVWPSSKNLEVESPAHRDVAFLFGRTDVISAGFVVFDESGAPACYGESESLNIKSRPEDSDALFEQMIGRKC
jgi:hypothetical protein